MSARAELTRWFGCCRLLLAVLSFAPSSLAEEAPSVTLDWHAPVECPDRTELLARVEQLRGAHGQRSEVSPLEVRSFVTLLPDGRFRAQLDMLQSGNERTRVLEAPTCTGVTEASAVVIALAISPAADVGERASAMISPEPTATLVAPPHAPATTSADAGAPAPKAPSNSATPWAVAASAGVAVDFGATADASVGASLLGRLLRGEQVSFGLRGSFFPSRASTVPSQPSQGVDILLVAVAPFACASPFDLPLELAACAEFEGGALRSSGFGPPLHTEHWSSWLAPGAGLSAAFPKRGRVRSLITGDALFPLNRTEFRLVNVGVPHRLPSVAPRVGLYLELSFP